MSVCWAFADKDTCCTNHCHSVPHSRRCGEMHRQHGLLHARFHQCWRPWLYVAPPSTYRLENDLSYHYFTQSLSMPTPADHTWTAVVICSVLEHGKQDVWTLLGLPMCTFTGTIFTHLVGPHINSIFLVWMVLLLREVFEGI